MNKNSNPWARLKTNNFTPATLRYFLQNEVEVKSFLSKIWENGTLALAVHDCGLDPFEINEIAEKDDNFRHSIEAAKAYAVDLVEGQIYRNGRYGYEEIEKDAEGNVIKSRRKYDNRCLLEYVKNHRQEPLILRKENTVEVLKKPLMQPGDTIPINPFNHIKAPDARK